MFPSDLENAYAYEVERRKDEMRDAAKNRFANQFVKKSPAPFWLLAMLIILTILLAILLAG